VRGKRAVRCARPGLRARPHRVRLRCGRQRVDGKALLLRGVSCLEVLGWVGLRRFKHFCEVCDRLVHAVEAGGACCCAGLWRRSQLGRTRRERAL
jgi:hypothetical protein